jgi:hypothetical protein
LVHVGAWAGHKWMGDRGGVMHGPVR